MKKRSLTPRLAVGLATLPPSYFGLVMATGIVALAAHMLGHATVATFLFALNIVQYTVLSALYALRALLFPRQFFGDMGSHTVGPGYFTAIAGTGVLASQFIVQRADYLTGTILTIVATVLWVLLVYGILTALVVKREKPPFAGGINGSWLLAVVGTQAISVASTLLARHGHSEFLGFVALTTWLWGSMLYIWLITLIFHRQIFWKLPPEELTPPYWINMGATAISTLAGAELILHASATSTATSLLPFIRGFTLLFWATGTWWIPMLLLLGVWRYGYERFPFRYTPLYWAAVFPLGMYAACTFRLMEAIGLPFLTPIPIVFYWAALFAWGTTFAGMLHRLTTFLPLRRRQTLREP